MKRALCFILSLSLAIMTPSFTSLAEEADLAPEEVITVEAENAEAVEEEIEEVAVTEDVIVAVENVEVDDAVAEAIETLAAYEENEEKIAGPLSATVLANKTAATLNSQVVISATVSGAPNEEITYYWQKSADGVTWGGTSLNGSKTATLSFTATEARLANYYRVVVKCGGYKAYSNAVKVELAEDATITISANKDSAPLNAKIVITGTTANTVGEVSYKWQKSTDGTTWQSTSLTGCNSAELSFTATEARLNNYYRLVVTDENRHWYSNSVKIDLIDTPTIIAFSQDSELSIGDVAIFEIQTENLVGDVTYQWQKSLDGQTGWSTTKLNGYNTPQLSFNVTEARLNYYYRVKVRDDNGVWYSNPVKINFTIPEPVCGLNDVFCVTNNYDFQPDLAYLNDYDLINDGSFDVVIDAFGTSKVEISAELMNVEPIFGTDQTDAIEVAYGSEDPVILLNAYDLLSDDCEYAKIKITLYDENYDLNNYTETYEFGLRFVKHYAVLVCNSDYNGDGDAIDDGDLAGVANDARVMSNMLNTLGWNVTLVENATSDDMLDVIAEGFKNAKEWDVCLFYYSGHGLGDYDWVDYLDNPNVGLNIGDSFVHIGDALGALCGVGVGSDFLFLPELACALNDACPGKVAVLMDSCFSGAAIDVASTDENNFVVPVIGPHIPADLLIRSYNDAVIKAFDKVNNKITTRSSKTGALCYADKFYVITACGKDQTSLDASVTLNNNTTLRCGLFTYGLLAGFGVSYPDGAFEDDAPGDFNGDYYYSLSEAFESASMVAEDHHDSMIDLYTDYYQDYFLEIFENYPDNLTEDQEEDLAYFGGELDPDGFETFEAYWEHVLSVLCGDCQITCAFGDPNFVLFSRVLVDLCSPSTYEYE